jgi:hypothetical protein
MTAITSREQIDTEGVEEAERTLANRVWAPLYMRLHHLRSALMRMS